MRLPRILSRHHTNPSAPFYYYALTPNPVPSNGAENFVFQRKWTDPVQMLEGAGKRAGQFMIYQPAQLRAQLALTAASLHGAGVFSGSTEMQRLWRENQYGQIDVGEQVIA